MDSSLLCSVSSRGTCHIWKLTEGDDKLKNKLIEGRRSCSQIQIPDFSSKTGTFYWNTGQFFYDYKVRKILDEN